MMSSIELHANTHVLSHLHAYICRILLAYFWQGGEQHRASSVRGERWGKVQEKQLQNTHMSAMVKYVNVLPWVPDPTSAP